MDCGNGSVTVNVDTKIPVQKGENRKRTLKRKGMKWKGKERKGKKCISYLQYYLIKFGFLY